VCGPNHFVLVKEWSSQWEKGRNIGDESSKKGGTPEGNLRIRPRRRKRFYLSCKRKREEEEGRKFCHRGQPTVGVLKFVGGRGPPLGQGEEKRRAEANTWNGKEKKKGSSTRGTYPSYFIYEGRTRLTLFCRGKRRDKRKKGGGGEKRGDDHQNLGKTMGKKRVQNLSKKNLNYY